MGRARVLVSMVFGLLSALGAAACEDAATPETGETVQGCASGQVDCGAGCVDLLSSVVSCGQCGVTCGAGEVCSVGACSCSGGLQKCGAACVDTLQDANNCGVCGNICSAGASCLGGTCSCQAGRSDCAGQCVDFQSDGNNCGGCGIVCGQGTFCSAGVCGSACPTGTVACGASCVDTQTDEANCGTCNRICSAGQECAAGVCGCTGGLTLCNGACVNTMGTDPNNCGGCGLACTGGQTCVAGACTCPTGQQACGGVCTTLASDPNNCGGCGLACMSGQTCESGACVGGLGTGGAGSGGAGTGGAGAGTGSTAGTGGTTGSTCADVSFDISSSLNSQISTVGVVAWSVNTNADSGYIDFGRTAGAWEYRAPVETVSQAGNQTLLLGMKGSTTYSYQVSIQRGSETCSSDVQTITTGAIRNGLPQVSMNTPNPNGVYEGFTITCIFAMGGGFPGGPTTTSGSWTFIIDKDGDQVWWYQPSGISDCSRARMSYDGQFMWMGNVNVMGGQGALVRVGMDGSGEQSFNLTDRHHDFAVMPDDRLALIEHKSGGAAQGDIVSMFDPSTNQKQQIFDVAQANPNGQQQTDSHANAINWWPDQNLFTISALYWDSITGFDQSGNVQWIMGGANSTFTGASWTHQHNHALTANSLLLFNNGNGGSSRALEFQMNGNSATQIFEYATGSNTSSGTLGDAKRLPNGNTLVTFSNAGVIHEVDSSGQLVQEITVDQIGYTVRRATLYGPPPPYAP